MAGEAVLNSDLLAPLLEQLGLDEIEGLAQILRLVQGFSAVEVITEPPVRKVRRSAREHTDTGSPADSKPDRGPHRPYQPSRNLSAKVDAICQANHRGQETPKQTMYRMLQDHPGILAFNEAAKSSLTKANLKPLSASEFGQVKRQYGQKPAGTAKPPASGSLNWKEKLPIIAEAYGQEDNLKRWVGELLVESAGNMSSFREDMQERARFVNLELSADEVEAIAADCRRRNSGAAERHAERQTRPSSEPVGIRT